MFNLKPISITLFAAIIFLLPVVVNAQELPQTNQYLNSITIPQIPPGHIFYGLKISFENLQEAFTSNDYNRLLLKQKHLDDRLKEAQYMAVFKPDNIDIPLLEAQLKTIEIESLSSATPMSICSSNYCDTISHNQYVLNNLLNSSFMPPQSKIGLQNALNRSGMHLNPTTKQISPTQSNNSNKPVYVSANMSQGTYNTNPKVLKLIPFRTAILTDPRDNFQYSIIIKPDAIIIGDASVPSPDYYLYPTTTQLETIESISKSVNKQKSISFSDTIKLTKLWYSIQKIPTS